MYQNISRRKFMQAMCSGLGTYTLANQAIPNLWAQGMPPNSGQKRLLLFFSPNGTVPHRFYPSGTEQSFTIDPQSVLAPLNEIKTDLTIVKGLNFLTGNNHEGGMQSMLTNGHHETSVTAGKSLDQYIASQIRSTHPFPSLELGVLTDPWGASIQTRMCYQSASQYIHPDSDPRSVFRRLFGSSDSDQAQGLREKQYRRSVIDLVSRELNVLKSVTGGEAHRKLDQHLTAIREIETRLDLLEQIDCSVPQAPARLRHLDYQLLPELLTAQMDLAALAFACNLTPVITLQTSHTVSPVVFSWVGNTSSHHSLSHAANDTHDLDQFILAEQWCATQFKQLVQTMKNTDDPINGGSLFDHTVIVWIKEMGDSRLHICESVPFVIAGTGGGHWQTGRFLQYEGLSHSHLLVSLCHAMGLDNTTFGDPNTGIGPLPGLV